MLYASPTLRRGEPALGCSHRVVGQSRAEIARAARLAREAAQAKNASLQKFKEEREAANLATATAGSSPPRTQAAPEVGGTSTRIRIKGHGPGKGQGRQGTGTCGKSACRYRHFGCQSMLLNKASEASHASKSCKFRPAVIKQAPR